MAFAVSIHAPRAGCDYTLVLESPRARRFNSRTPCGVRLIHLLQYTVVKMFQFTHPVRGATVVGNRHSLSSLVSIHAPRAGCDPFQLLAGLYRILFQFTHPVRGATEMGQLIPFLCQVSIHAPRAGCDLLKRLLTLIVKSFNSRTPCGVRHRCPKVRINRRLDVDPLRIEDYKRVCQCVGGDCEAVCACISTCANSLPFL